MTGHHADLGGTSDWLQQSEVPPRSGLRHVISMEFRRETSGRFAKCRLFPQAEVLPLFWKIASDFCVYSSKTANPYLRLVYLFIQYIEDLTWKLGDTKLLAENEWNVYYINTNETPTLKYIFAAIYYNHNNCDLFTCERESLSGIHRYLQYSAPLMAVLSMTLVSISITPVNRD